MRLALGILPTSQTVDIFQLWLNYLDRMHASCTLFKIVFLLLSVYAIAAILPGPGLWIGTILPSEFSLSKLLLVALLFLAGAGLSKDNTVRLRSLAGTVIWFSMAIWCVPLIAVLGTLLIAAQLWPELADEIKLAAIVIAAMPVANATVGWAKISGGNIAVSLSLLAISTAASPIVSPFIVSIGQRLYPHQTPFPFQATWQSQMPTFLLYWVLLPILFGFLTSRLMSVQGQGFWDRTSKLCSLSILLIINYLNACPVLPEVIRHPEALVAPTGVVVIQLTMTWLILRLVEFGKQLSFGRAREKEPFERDICTSFELAILMKNTGAALVFIAVALPNMPQAILTIIMFTIAQHIVVSLSFVDSVSIRKNTEISEIPCPLSVTSHAGISNQKL